MGQQELDLGSLNIPLRERNVLLLASGDAPVYSEQSMDAEQIQIVLLTDAVANSCTYAVAVHTTLALQQGGPGRVDGGEGNRGESAAPTAAIPWANRRRS